MTRSGRDNCVGLESSGVVGGIVYMRVCSWAAPTLKRVVVVRGLEVGRIAVGVCGACWLAGGLSVWGWVRAADSD